MKKGGVKSVFYNSSIEEEPSESIWYSIEIPILRYEIVFSSLLKVHVCSLAAH